MRFLPILVLILFMAAPVFAGSLGVTPYGDYCQWCGEYGTCKENLEPKQAEKAMERYFANKGLKVINLRHRERFVEAEIYRNRDLVDKVLFDRKTGRIRSTY